MTTTPATAPPVRTRADIERDLASKRAERELYVTPEVRLVIDAQIDAFLDEWLAAG